MKKLANLTVLIITAVFCIVIVAGAANAADKIMAATPDSVTVAMDKNGTEYVRFIVPEDRSLQGVKYVQGVPVMAFGNLVEKAKTIKAGEPFKAIVGSKEYKGNTSYTIIAFID